MIDMQDQPFLVRDMCTGDTGWKTRENLIFDDEIVKDLHFTRSRGRPYSRTFVLLILSQVWLS